MENISVEDLSGKLEGDRTVIIQEVTPKKQRQWVFQGERLRELWEQKAGQGDYSNASDVIFVCEEMEKCREQARQIQAGINVGFLAGGYLAWGQFYHPVLVGFDDHIKVWQIHRLAKGCLSYMIISGETCIVIDPCYHIDYYLGLAHNQRTDIKCLIDTQIHQDHVSGAARLAAKTGSPYYVPSHDHLKADSQALEKQREISVGDARLTVIPLNGSNSIHQNRVCLLLNNRYLFIGDSSLEIVRQSMENQTDLRHMDQTVLVLPAHLQTLGMVNKHGIVATTLVAREQESEQGKQRFSVSQPEAKKEDIIHINLSQEEIDLDTANQMELGLDHTP